MTDGFGYFLEQSTRPQTIGYALLDSPVGLAAWMLDHDTDSYYKIAARVRRRQARGQPHPRQHPRQHHAVLADGHRRLGGPVVLGGRTGQAHRGRRGSAAGRDPGRLHDLPRRDLPTPRSWVEAAFPTLAYFNEVDKGGHFAAWEEPELFATEIRADVQVGSLAMTTGVDLPVEGRLAVVRRRDGWLNSPPLTPEELRGKVVLVDFWTYTCINWLRTLAWVRAWADRYGDQGLVVVGVHTPEFPFERDADNVTRAVAAMDVRYPVALDPDYAVWSAFANSYWPAAYIADAEGQIRHHHFGEGAYDEQERAIQEPARHGRRARLGRADRASRCRPTGRTSTRPRRTSAPSKA